MYHASSCIQPSFASLIFHRSRVLTVINCLTRSVVVYYALSLVLAVLSGLLTQSGHTALGRHLAVLVWAQKRGCEWNWSICAFAASA